MYVADKSVQYRFVENIFNIIEFKEDFEFCQKYSVRHVRINFFSYKFKAFILLYKRLMYLRF